MKKKAIAIVKKEQKRIIATLLGISIILFIAAVAVSNTLGLPIDHQYVWLALEVSGGSFALFLLAGSYLKMRRGRADRKQRRERQPISSHV